MNEIVEIEICARYGFGIHETKKIRLRSDAPGYLTMSKRTYDKYTKLLCCPGADYLCQVDRNSDYCVIVRNVFGKAVAFF